jgi:hypothetical protein
MNKLKYLFAGLLCIFCIEIKAQDSDKKMEESSSLLAGYHAGIVQIMFAVNKDNFTTLDKYDFYFIGFPFGITFNTHGKLKFDLEFVPIIKPYFNSGVPIQVHLLFHPGILYPLGKGWTFGFRLAYENSVNQIGFTPLINKGFKRKNNSVFFLELVAPARFGPEKNSGYTQLGGLHIGIGF